MPQPATDDDQVECPSWVKLRRTQCEQMSSGLLLKADIARCGRHVSNVPTGDMTRRRGRQLIRPDVAISWRVEGPTRAAERSRPDHCQMNVLRATYTARCPDCTEHVGRLSEHKLGHQHAPLPGIPIHRRNRPRIRLPEGKRWSQYPCDSGPSLFAPGGIGKTFMQICFAPTVSVEAPAP